LAGTKPQADKHMMEVHEQGGRSVWVRGGAQKKANLRPSTPKITNLQATMERGNETG